MNHRRVSLLFLLALVSIFTFFGKTPILPMLLFILVFLFIILLAYGSFNLSADYFLTSIHKGVQGGVSLTFDDGPDEKTTGQILDILEKEKIKGAFFVIGKKAEKNPELMKRIASNGHLIGNHSYDHNNSIAFYSRMRLEEDLRKCSNIIELTAGVKTSIFRPPFGVTNPKYQSVLKKLNLSSIGWSVRSFDSVKTDAPALVSSITKQVKANDILLFHDTRQVTLEALPAIISHCRNNNLKIVPLDVLLNLPLNEAV